MKLVERDVVDGHDRTLVKFTERNGRIAAELVDASPHVRGRVAWALEQGNQLLALRRIYANSTCIQLVE